MKRYMKTMKDQMSVPIKLIFEVEFTKCFFSKMYLISKSRHLLRTRILHLNKIRLKKFFSNSIPPFVETRLVLAFRTTENFSILKLNFTFFR
ncbi:hypothetical protein AMS66_19780 [Paenibacillus xylanivorans]|uniref:Uncharacterized protein n=1 Tax=Paenibacillus xylanivorans TaxID=1705561 RepID=A0A0N0C3S3_9BACL|nr:hypothetical protein AMS66_19780 [Paenibacillus xylanivorans]